MVVAKAAVWSLCALSCVMHDARRATDKVKLRHPHLKAVELRDGRTARLQFSKEQPPAASYPNVRVSVMSLVVNDKPVQSTIWSRVSDRIIGSASSYPYQAVITAGRADEIGVVFLEGPNSANLCFHEANVVKDRASEAGALEAFYRRREQGGADDGPAIRQSAQKKLPPSVIAAKEFSSDNLLVFGLAKHIRNRLKGRINNDPCLKGLQHTDDGWVIEVAVNVVSLQRGSKELSFDCRPRKAGELWVLDVRQRQPPAEDN